MTRKIEKTCDCCKKLFKVFFYRKDSARFCSRECKKNFISGNASFEKVTTLNFSKFYGVTKSGKVWSFRLGRFLRGTLTNLGYVQVELSIQGKGKNFLVHRLVAETFIENNNNLPEVNHKDGNKENNSVENLEWVTSSENQLHAYATGLEVHPIAEDWHNTILTRDQAKFILDKCSPGRGNEFNYTRLGEMFGVSSATIRCVFLGQSWKHIR